MSETDDELRALVERLRALVERLRAETELLSESDVWPEKLDEEIDRDLPREAAAALTAAQAQIAELRAESDRLAIADQKASGEIQRAADRAGYERGVREAAEIARARAALAKEMLPHDLQQANTAEQIATRILALLEKHDG